jgi:2-dehydro-3-deoxy-D-arabinonate dehydratase
MRIFKLKSGILIEQEGSCYLIRDHAWDEFINDDHLEGKINGQISTSGLIEDPEKLLKNELEAPIESQEIWASGVTYYNSKIGRQEESKNSGGGAFYTHVYDAPRPELFYKASANRTVGSGGMVRTREDSTWDVPEPELTLFITSNGRIIGYTIGNDMSSRSIEGENPLYLPQAKTYDGSAALGPCIYVTSKPLDGNTLIAMKVSRGSEIVFKGEVKLSQMKRNPEELVRYLFRECTFPSGVFLMTGTGIVPTKDFTLHKGDKIIITIEPIGNLINTVE